LVWQVAQRIGLIIELLYDGGFGVLSGPAPAGFLQFGMNTPEAKLIGGYCLPCGLDGGP
jgi:hypothetical protein